MQDRINGVRRQLGQARTPDRSKPDLTDAGLEALHVCYERLQVRSQVRHLNHKLWKQKKHHLVISLP